MLEILDLSLHVMRVFAVPLLLTFSLGVIPAMIMNHFLIGWMSDVVYDDQFPYGYMWSMMLLVFIEAPLVSIFATCYLGQAVFQERPSIRRVFADVARLWSNVFWYQMIVRVVAPVLILFSLTRINEFIVPVYFCIVGLVGLNAIIRSVRPFINEIIVLERNPLRSRDPNTQTVTVRSQRLHTPAAGDLFGRWLASAFLAILLWCGFYGLFLFGSGVLLNDWRQGSWAIEICYPLSLWMVAFFFTVVRFLCYLDTRIRQEGWEVELKLRAEATKLASKLT